MENIKIEKTLLGKPFILETGKFARLADGSVTVRFGDNVLLATVCMSKHPNKEADFFPLTVEYQEKFYAVGKIKGGRFMKREGKPSDNAILNGRLTDRPLRPLFPHGMVNDVQIVISVLSADEETDLGALAITAASCAVMHAGIPFAGPASGVRIGMIDNEIIVNPTNEQADKGQLDLVVGGTKDAILMVEAGAKMVSEEKMLQAIQKAHEVIREFCLAQEEFIQKCSVETKTVEYNLPSEEVVSEITAFLQQENLLSSLFVKSKAELNEQENILHAKVAEHFDTKIKDENLSDWNEKKVNMALFDIMKEFVRNSILDADKRLDGRRLDEIRPISGDVSLLPRAHGSGLFNRGDTQALSVVTLGSPGDAQIVDEMEGEEYTRKYMHHYNMPPFSTGEAKPMRGTNRREIGHGFLAERAIAAVIPDEKDFPYTIRVVSEILTSNGSTSMASTCGSTLALMDAGVPIKNPVSGIAMGLISGEQGKFKILSDIQGMEDFTGDMDFKVAGTKDGITALQMDMKITGITMDILKQALSQAHTGRMFILGKILEILPQSRKELSDRAPRITTLQILPDQIREVIGSGGKTINKIIAETGVQIDISDTGLICITSKTPAAAEKATKIIKDITYIPQIGDIIEGRINRIEAFGAFVEITDSMSGLVHISNLMPFRVNRVEDHFKIGDMIKTRVVSMDAPGKVGLSHKEFEQQQQ